MKNQDIFKVDCFSFSAIHVSIFHSETLFRVFSKKIVFFLGIWSNGKQIYIQLNRVNNHVLDTQDAHMLYTQSL